MGIPTLSAEVAPLATPYDSVVLVATSVLDLPYPFAPALARAKAADKSLGEDGTAVVAVDDASLAAGGRVVVAAVGKLDRDYDDVRRFGDAAAAGILRAKAAGSVRPLLLLHGAPPAATSSSFQHALPVALLAALHALYEPLQAHESLDGEQQQQLEPIQQIGFVCDSAETGASLARWLHAIESGRRLARDLGGSDPERMTPQRCAEYITASLDGLPVSVQVVSDLEQLRTDYPLAHAVARSSLHVARHHPRIVRLEYTGSGPIDETLLFSGKGIVYDTGGADIKTGGCMAGMHLDKAGASNIAGFVKTVALLQPAGLRVVAELGFVRNSCGSDSYVADEILRSHAGARVQVLNTDAEGRMVLSDMLSHLRASVLDDKAANPNPKLFTCATLTGHAARSVGPYTIAMDNGAAHAQNVASSLQDVATAWGEPLEVSLLRREDFQWAKPKHKKADVLQMGNAVPAGARGHQYGASFLILSSGLDKHGVNSDFPLSYTHIDIAGSAAESSDYKFGKPTAVPIVGLTSRFVLPRLQQRDQAAAAE